MRERGLGRSTQLGTTLHSSLSTTKPNQSTKNHQTTAPPLAPPHSQPTPDHLSLASHKHPASSLLMAPPGTKNYYKVLSIDDKADDEAIKKAYKKVRSPLSSHHTSEEPRSLATGRPNDSNNQADHCVLLPCLSHEQAALKWHPVSIKLFFLS